MQKSPLSRLWAKAAFAVVALGVSGAFAGLTPPQPFATFQNGNLHFTSSVAGGSGLFSDVSPTSLPTFEFLEPVSNGLGVNYAANQPIVANLTLTTSATVAATGSPLVDQPLSIGTWTFTDTTPNHNVLLTISGFTSDLTGRIGFSTANLSLDTAAGNVLTYSSDFLNFSPNNVGISSNSLTLDNGSTVGVNADTFLNSFTANVEGAFSATSVSTNVPEPASLGLISLAGFILLGRRARQII